MSPDDRPLLAQALFEFLERDGLAYCVLGDARRLDREVRSDVDIVVAHEALGEMSETISRFCRERGAHVVQLIRHERTALYFVIAWAGPSGGPRFLALDFCSHYMRRGRPLLGADELLEGRELAGGGASARPFYVPRAPVRFVYYLLKKIDKGELDDRHGEYLSESWRLDPARAWAQLTRFWPRAAEANLIARAAERNEWGDVRGQLAELRAMLHRAAPRTVGGIAGELRRAVTRARQPTGAVIAVLGPDGSGKSSVIGRVLEDLAPVFRGTVHLHLRPGLISAPRRKSRQRSAVDDPHGAPPRGLVMSLVKLAGLLVDYTAGYALRVWPHTVRSRLVAFDRYYHDLLVDPLRLRYGGPALLARVLGAFVPAPHLYVLLDAPATLLQARKSEVTEEESARQRQDYLALMRRYRDSAVFDAAHPIEEVAQEIEFAVLGVLAHRLEARHPDLREYQNPLPARLLLFFCRNRVPVLSRLVRIAFNSDIYCRMRSPILIPHPYGIVIHSRARIGSHVTVMQQVTIGGKDRGENVAPVIEDDVYIGAGAKVLGGIRVGRGATIGANAVVTRDVPPHSTVVGVNRIVRGGAPRTLEVVPGSARGHAGARGPMTA